MEATLSTISKDAETELWHQMHANPSDNVRFKLIDHYTYLARSIAAKLYRNRYYDDVEFDDYLQFAMIGLIESVDRYDPNSEASFSTYAGYRIKGALLNGLEKTTEKREQGAYRRRHEKARINSIASNLKNSTDENLFSDMVSVAIELAFSYMLEDSGILAKESDVNEDPMFRGRVNAELDSQLMTIVSELPDREKFIILSHYFYSIGFDQLGEQLNVKKSRVSQLHKRALQMIKIAFENSEGLDMYY